MNSIGETFLQMFIEIIIFLSLTYLGVFVYKKITNSRNRYSNPTEFLPEDEVHTLKQVFYLIMMALCFVNVIYTFTFSSGEYFYITIFDIVLSLAVAVHMDKSTWKNRIILLLLVPYASLSMLLFNSDLTIIIDYIHIPLFLYFVVYYFEHFREYTESHGLTVAIILLFIIIFVSFFVTQITEGTNALDSLVMVSNAFTSNGYSVLGHSITGKLNSLFLVWGGYVISGAGTATLTASLLIRHFNKRLEELEKIMEEGSEE